MKLLRAHGHEVTVFWDDGWRGGARVDFTTVRDYDCIIMFQCICAATCRYFAEEHPNVVFVPMLDQFGIFSGPHDNLQPLLSRFFRCKILSFSKAVHAIAISSGIMSRYVQYYPNPATQVDSQGLRGFFWLRHEEHVSWPLVRKLMGNTAFSSLHIHLACDPGAPPPVMPTEEETRKYHITVSRWFDKKIDFLRIMEQANVFFAPRLEEGIGQSFLEAMSRGQCVIAADCGTMNEYIVHGVNGLLYAHDNPQPLDFSLVPELCAAAYAGARAGYDRWIACRENIAQFVVTPASYFYPAMPMDTPFSKIRKRIRNSVPVKGTERLWLPLWCKGKSLLEK